VRVASFNVENLFERARALQLDWDEGRAILERYARINQLLNKPVYSDEDKSEIKELLRQLGLARSDVGARYAELLQVRGRLLRRTPRLEIVATGRSSPTVPVDKITESVVQRIRSDAEFAELVAQHLRGQAPTFARSIDELIANDEDDAVEFKSTARWDLREARRNPALEDAIVKTVAAFLNCQGGTLLIGVGPDRSLVGLKLDYAQVKPPNGDGFVNWLTTHLSKALGAAAVMRTRARVVTHADLEICRLDVASSSRPVWAKTSKGGGVFFVRMNNSSRPMPPEELEAYLVDRWPDTSTVAQV
jgi:type I restriction enzyme R subunit